MSRAPCQNPRTTQGNQYAPGVIARTRFLGTTAAFVTLASVLTSTATYAAADQVEPSITDTLRAGPVATVTSRDSRRNSNEIAAYTSVVPRSVSSSQVQARAIIVAGSPCPKLVTNLNRRGQEIRVTRRMRLRTPGATTGAAFASLAACQASIPTGATSAMVGGRGIPSGLPATIGKVAILGDTGCRIKPPAVQDCSNPDTWPATQIASSIAAQKPDVIVDLGDYFYREAACPADKQSYCGTSPPPLPGAPFKDSANGWLADVIVPLSPMFAAAPLLLTRGNHEACQRGGNGYFLFFDVSSGSSQACAPVDGVTPSIYNPTWVADLPIAAKRTLRLAIVDTPYGSDYELDSWVGPQRPGYAAAAKLTRRKAHRESWLLTHEPVFGLESTDLSTGTPTWTPWMSPDQAAASQGLLGTYDLIASSHIHLTQAVQIPGQPGQLVVGNGGQLLDPPSGYAMPTHGPLTDGTGAPLSNAIAPYPTPTSIWTDVRFGYVIAKPGKRAREWTFTHRSPTGSRFATCKSFKTQISCAGQ